MIYGRTLFRIDQALGSDPVKSMNAFNDVKYKYLSFMGGGIIVAILLGANQDFHNWVISLGTWEYLGAFVAGMLFVSSFTVAASVVVIGILSDNINPLVLGVVGGFGAMIGDLLILRYIKDHLTDELKMLFGKEGTSYVRSVIHSKYISWTLPIIGAFIIASPLPDELGVSLLGLSDISQKKFMLISYVSNFLGILAIASVAKVI